MTKWNVCTWSKQIATAAGVLIGVSLAPGIWAQEALDATQPRITPVAAVPKYLPDIDPAAPHAQPAATGPENINTFSQIVSADISTNGVTTLDFAALILDRDPTDNLFIKVQGQTGNGKFSNIGFYHGNNTGGWAGITGGSAFLSLAAADQFTSAHMTVIHDGLGNVTLQLTNVVGGTNNQVYTRGGWTPRNAPGVGFGCLANGYSVDNWGHDSVCDDFTRANGPLGPDWVTTDGTSSIVGNTAHGDGGSRSIYVGACGGGLAVVEADISVSSVPAFEYSALALNGDGTDNLYIKVQAVSPSTAYTNIGFYHDSTSSGWAGMTGGVSYFALPANQVFNSAHMKVILEPSGNVRLILTNMDLVPGPLEFSRGGWVVRNGHAAGFGGYNGNSAVDNFSVNGLGVIDSFNRANGGLGANWQTITGSASIVGGTAHGGAGSLSLSWFTGSVGNNSSCVADIAPPGGDGAVNVADLLKVITSWGGCP